MRRIADLHPGTAKTDARGTYVIPDAARTLPHTLRRVDTGEETLAELEVLVGYDDALAGEATPLEPHPRPAHPDPPRPGTGAWPEGPAPSGSATSCSPCSATKSPTDPEQRHKSPPPLDEPHGDTPPRPDADAA